MNFIFSCLKHFKYNLLSLKKKIYFKKFASIGSHSIIAPNSQLVPKNMYIGDYVLLQDHLNFISNKGKLIVKDFSVISANCIIVPGSHLLKVGVPFFLAAAKHIADAENDITIEEDCWIGAGCILLPGVTIGRGCVIGAGSVVTKDIPDYAVAVGVPARVIATKFSLENVIKHEAALYPKDKRREIGALEMLFTSLYANINPIGDSLLTDSDKLALKEAQNQYGIIDYNV